MAFYSQSSQIALTGVHASSARQVGHFCYAVYSKEYQTRDEAKKDLFNYIEVFYNRQRRYTTLGYVSPADFERRYELNPEQAA